MDLLIRRVNIFILIVMTIVCCLSAGQPTLELDMKGVTDSGMLFAMLLLETFTTLEKWKNKKG